MWLFTHVRHAVIPLAFVALNVNPLPWKQARRIRIHSLHVWLLHPASTGGRQWHYRLRFKCEGFGPGHQIITLLPISRAVGFVEQRGVLRIPPTRSVRARRRVVQAEK